MSSHCILHLDLLHNILSYLYYILFFHKYDYLFGSSLPWVFLWKSVLGVCSGFVVWLPYQSVISIKFLYSFVGVTLRRGCSLVNLLRIFRALLCGSTDGGMLLSFSKTLLSVIVRFKGTFTYYYHCFDCFHHLKCTSLRCL